MAKFFYHAELNPNGFYCDDINVIPAGAVEVDAEVHAELLSHGRRIVPGPGGLPAVEPEYVPTIEDLAAMARAKRSLLLDAADKKVNTIEDEGGDASAWRTYRVALRRLPKQFGFPTSIDWPAEPTQA